MTERRLAFDNPRPLPREAVRALLEGTDAGATAEALVSAALHDEDGRWVQEQCLRLSRHADPNVRRLAGVCLGHVARIHGSVDQDQALAILSTLRSDTDGAVRAAVDDVLDDLREFLGWEPFLGSIRPTPKSATPVSDRETAARRPTVSTTAHTLSGFAVVTLIGGLALLMGAHLQRVTILATLAYLGLAPADFRSYEFLLVAEVLGLAALGVVGYRYCISSLAGATHDPERRSNRKPGGGGAAPPRDGSADH